MTIPFALSVSHFINSVGAKAGFAAIIGLALLVLLFFAQMRETARLREDAQDAADHVAQLEQRLASLARGVAGAGAGQSQAAPAQTAPAQAAVAPRPASAMAAASGAGAVSRARPLTAEAPIAPAGLGAPALASATRMIPAFDDGPLSVRRSGAAAPVAGMAGGEAANGGGARTGAAVMDPPGPPPATAAGGATPGNGSQGRVPSPVGAGTAAAPRPSGGARPPAPRNGGRPPASGDRRDYRASGGGPGRNLLAGGIALLVVAAVVVVLLVLTSSGSGGSTAQSSSTPISNAPAKKHRATHRAVTLKPGSVNVTVLNGTSTTGLAGDVTRKLQADGYKLGTPATATDQTHTSTIVAYLPGHQAAAAIVAKSLGLGANTISAADQTSQAVACPSGTTCTAQVIVTVGTDLAGIASSSSSSAAAPAAGATSTG